MPQSPLACYSERPASSNRAQESCNANYHRPCQERIAWRRHYSKQQKRYLQAQQQLQSPTKYPPPGRQNREVMTPLVSPLIRFPAQIYQYIDVTPEYTIHQRSVHQSNHPLVIVEPSNCQINAPLHSIHSAKVGLLDEVDDIS